MLAFVATILVMLVLNRNTNQKPADLTAEILKNQTSFLTTETTLSSPSLGLNKVSTSPILKIPIKVTLDNQSIATNTPKSIIFLVEVLSLTSPVTRGSKALLSIKTESGASCSLKVTLPSGSISSAQGLQGNKIPNQNGVISWEWRIGSTTKPGIAKLDLTCNKDGSSLIRVLEMIITG